MNLKDRAQSKFIDSVEYRCWPLTFDLSRPLLVRVSKILAPILGSAFSGMVPEEQAANALDAFSKSTFSDADLKALGDAFGNASEYLDGDKWVPLVSQNQMFHFAARFDAFFLWLLFAMEVNGFASFFDGLKREAKAMMTDPTAESPTST